MEIFAVFFVAGQSGNTKVECGGGIGKEAQVALKAAMSRIKRNCTGKGEEGFRER